MLILPMGKSSISCRFLHGTNFAFGGANAGFGPGQSGMEKHRKINPLH